MRNSRILFDLSSSVKSSDSRIPSCPYTQNTAAVWISSNWISPFCRAHSNNSSTSGTSFSHTLRESWSWNFLDVDKRQIWYLPYLSSTSRKWGIHQTASSVLAPRDSHPNCGSHRAAPIAWSCFAGLWLDGSIIILYGGHRAGQELPVVYCRIFIAYKFL